MNNVYIKHYADEDSLTHYGVKGMKWRHHKSIFGLHTGYNEDITRQLQEAAQVRNMERDAHRNDGSIKQRLGQAGLAARAEAKRRQSASYRVSSVFKKAGRSTLGASKKAVSKGKSIFNNIRSSSASVEKKARWGVYKRVRAPLKSKYTPEQVVKLPANKRNKEFAKNRRANNVAVFVSGINKYYKNRGMSAYVK